MHRFEIFDFQNDGTLKTGLGVRQGHWKYHPSIERVRRTTSYWRSIVTMALSRVVLRYSMSKNVVTLKSGQRSLKVIDSVIIR